jgi:hypothetical protein
MHQHSTSGIRRRKKKKKVPLHMLAHGAMQGCGLTSLVGWFNEKKL